MNPKFSLSVIAASCLLLACVCTCRGEEPSPYVRDSNLVYQVHAGVGLILDVFKPTGDSNGLGIVDTLSGAWYSEQGQVNDHLRAQVFDTYCRHGYTVFMIRPGSRTLFTAEQMVANLKTGIRWVKAHAGEYGIDADRLGITGASAGGHLTLLSVVTAEAGDAKSKDPLMRFSTEVKAAAVFFPPTDFLEWEKGQPRDLSRLGDLLFEGGLSGKTETEIEAKAREVSPAHRVEGKLPPILLIHGDADSRVPLEQSEKMVHAIRSIEGNLVELVVKKGGGHPWPTIPEEVEVIANWFDRQLNLP